MQTKMTLFSKNEQWQAAVGEIPARTVRTFSFGGTRDGTTENSTLTLTTTDMNLWNNVYVGQEVTMTIDAAPPA